MAKGPFMKTLDDEERDKIIELVRKEIKNILESNHPLEIQLDDHIRGIDTTIKNNEKGNTEALRKIQNLYSRVHNYKENLGILYSIIEKVEG